MSAEFRGLFLLNGIVQRLWIPGSESRRDGTCPVAAYAVDSRNTGQKRKIHGVKRRGADSSIARIALLKETTS